jgi:hypothetical protein
MGMKIGRPFPKAEGGFKRKFPNLGGLELPAIFQGGAR